MIVRFLGTSAGELYPGLWCRCRNCEAARHGSPKNQRQSAALYIETGAPADSAETSSSSAGVLIDFPSEIASQVLKYGIDLTSLQYLLVTHSHGDHWFPYLLRWRSRPAELCLPDTPAPSAIGGPRLTELPLLNIWGNSAVEAVLERELGPAAAPYAAEFHRAAPGAGFHAADLAVTPVPANHDVGREEALHYILQSPSATILYGLDGDTFLPETRDTLRLFQFDLVILESTYGHGNGRNHRNFQRVLDEADWFRNEGLMTTRGRIVATHFSPHHCPPHEETSAYLGLHDIETAWDGMKISL